MASGRGPGRPRGAQQDPAARREALLQAAEGAIREHGPDVSMEQIAERAGVAKATLYDNFDGKAGLTQALIDRFGLRLLERFAQSLSRSLTAEQVLAEGIDAFVGFIEADPEIYRFVVRHHEGDALIAEITAPIGALIRAIPGPIQADETTASLLAHAILGTIISATNAWSQTRQPPRADFVRLLTSYVWSGIVGAGLEPDDRPVDLRVVSELIAAAQGGAPT